MTVSVPVCTMQVGKALLNTRAVPLVMTGCLALDADLEHNSSEPRHWCQGHGELPYPTLIVPTVKIKQYLETVMVMTSCLAMSVLSRKILSPGEVLSSWPVA